MSKHTTDLIKKGLKIEKTTQIIKIIIMITAVLYGFWVSLKILNYLQIIIGLLEK